MKMGVLGHDFKCSGNRYILSMPDSGLSLKLVAMEEIQKQSLS